MSFSKPSSRSRRNLKMGEKVNFKQIILPRWWFQADPTVPWHGPLTDLPDTGKIGEQGVLVRGAQTLQESPRFLEVTNGYRQTALVGGLWRHHLKNSLRTKTQSNEQQLHRGEERERKSYVSYSEGPPQIYTQWGATLLFLCEAEIEISEGFFSVHIQSYMQNSKLP